jgi:ABC-type phosphate transport system substrate-binding protein
MESSVSSSIPAVKKRLHFFERYLSVSNFVSSSPKECKAAESSRRRVEFLTQLKRWRKHLIFVLLALIVPGALTACKAEKPRTVSIDGSSTVYPLSKAIAEAFGKANPAVQFNIEFSGTGGGFKKFCAGRIDIAGASRPINSTESEQCKAQHIEYIELPVAFDSLSLLVNDKNTFVDCLSVNELRSMWEPAAEGKVSTWAADPTEFPGAAAGVIRPWQRLRDVRLFHVGNSRDRRQEQR